MVKALQSHLNNFQRVLVLNINFQTQSCYKYAGCVMILTISRWRDYMAGDLHIHTNASDGSLSAREVIKLAGNTKIEYIAITNHDCFIDLSELYLYAKSNNVNLIEGVELSSLDPKTNRRVHILCYLPKRKQFLEPICEQTTKNRADAGLEMAKKVAKLYPIELEDIQEVAKNSRCIYKQHITKALMNAGFTTKIFGDVFEELFNFQDGTCIVNCEQPDVYTVIESARKAGGVCVMAHPYTYNSIEILDELIEKNMLDGIEVWSSKSTQKQEEYLLELTKKHNLIATGGSDFHGGYSYRVSPIAVKKTPDKSIKAIIKLSKSRD